MHHFNDNSIIAIEIYISCLYIMYMYTEHAYALILMQITQFHVHYAYLKGD